jgi:hypothetical protein
MGPIVDGVLTLNPVSAHPKIQRLVDYNDSIVSYSRTDALVPRRVILRVLSGFPKYNILHIYVSCRSVPVPCKAT